MSTPPAEAKTRYRLIAWIVGVGAALLVGGYITSDQWLGLVGTLL